MRTYWQLALASLMIAGLSAAATLFALEKGQVSRSGGSAAARERYIEVSGDVFNLSWQLEEIEALQLVGKTVEIEAELKTSSPGKFRLQIFDGIGAGTSDLHKGDGKWAGLSVAHKVTAGAKFVRMRFVSTTPSPGKHVVLIRNLRAKADGTPMTIDHDSLMRSAGSRSDLMSGWIWDGAVGALSIRTE